MPHYEKLLIQIVNMAHICENDMIQLKDMFQIVATWLQFSTEEYTNSIRPIKLRKFKGGVLQVVKVLCKSFQVFL